MFASLKKMVKVSSRILVVLVLSLGVFAQIGLAEKITLRFQSWRLAEAIPSRIYEELRLDFEKLNPEISLKFEPVPYDDRLVKPRSQIAGGAPPDVLMMTEADVIPFASQGLLMNLDSLYEREGGKEFTGKLLEPLFDFDLYKGSYYGVPVEVVIIELLFYNKRMFREAGLPDRAPLTWGEFLHYAQRITKDTNQDGVIDRYGCLLWGKAPGDAAKFFVGWALRNGATLLDEKGTKFLLNTPKGLETLRFYTELWTQYKVTPDPIDLDFPTIGRLYAQGIGAMVQHGPWNKPITLEANPDMEGQIGVGASPLGPSAKTNVAQLLGSSMSIPSGVEHVDAAWKWITFLLEDKAQMEFAFGINFFPSVKRLLKSPRIMEAQDVIMRAGFDMVLNGQVNQILLNPQYPKIERAIWEELQNAWLEQKSPEKALSDMTARIDKLIGS